MSSLEHNQGELPKRLEKAAINELPLIRFHGTIHMAEDSKSWLVCPLPSRMDFGLTVQFGRDLSKPLPTLAEAKPWDMSA